MVPAGEVDFFYEPCAECASRWHEGVVLIEATVESALAGQPDYQGMYPTGRWLVVDEAGIPEIFAPEAAEMALASKMAFITSDIWSALGLPGGETQH